MPTLTRLAAAIIFAGFALYAGEIYKTLYEYPPRSRNGTVVLAAVAALVGWRFVGRHVDARLVQSIFQTLQGVILTVFLSLVIIGSYTVFWRGYQMRYSSLEDAFLGFVGVFVEHLVRMSDIDFLLLVGGMIVGTGIVLTLIFRWAEARRFDR
ncbi:TrgA family protein [Roseinatronobacter sp.]